MLNNNDDNMVESLIEFPEEARSAFKEFTMKHKLLCANAKSVKQIGTMEFILSVTEQEYVSFMKKNMKKLKENDFEQYQKANKEFSMKKLLNSGISREITYLSIVSDILGVEFGKLDK